MGEIRTSIDEPTATLTISNPDRRNAISFDMVTTIAETVRDLAYDDTIRCIVVVGDEDGGAFCAGADLRSRGDRPADPTAGTEPSYHRAVYEIMTAKKPVVAKIRGPAVGGGASIAAACDFVYADETARIGWVFARIGLTLDSGASFLLPRLLGYRRAIDILATGTILDAETALEDGLLTDVVPATELDDFVAERVEELAAGPTQAIGEMKRLLLRGDAQSLDEALYDESRAQALMFHTRDSSEGREAFLEERDPEFEGR